METEIKYKRTIFLFRRDFRLIDNLGLIKACQESEVVIPVFIFDEKQCVAEKNSYFSHASAQFMIESLKMLNEQLNRLGSRLFYFFGSYPTIFERVLDEVKPEAVYLNEDYTPFSIKRDQSIKLMCESKEIAFQSCNDIMLVEKGTVLKKDGTFYTDYIPYYVAAAKVSVPRPVIEVYKNFLDKNENFIIEFKEDPKMFYEHQEGINSLPGRVNAFRILNNMILFADYAKDRNLADKPTTEVSSYLKYGNISIRELYWAIADSLGKKHDLIRQLYWRDFYYNVLWFFPEAVYDSYWPQFRELSWEHNEVWFEAWKHGKTGYPLVDAAMRCLAYTHYLPNSLRLSASNFLAKVLGLDWRLGQRWFANLLVDYDLALNNGGWQWSASTGIVCQPYHVIFNPYTQSRTMDKECTFIRKWVPELRDVPTKHIQNWATHCHKYGHTNYPMPIVDFEDRKKYVINWYKELYHKEIPGTERKIHQRDIEEYDLVLLKEDMFENEMDEEENSNALMIDDF